MKSLIEYLNENLYIQEARVPKNVELPYTFDIYNSGPKNRDYKITKATIHNVYFASEQWPEYELDQEETKKNPGMKIYKARSPKYDWAFLISLPLPASEIRYKEWPDKSSTSNWTKVPELIDHTYCPSFAWKPKEAYNWNEYNYMWSDWLDSIHSYMHGKISVTMQKSGEKDEFGKEYVELHINDKRFNDERDSKIKEMSDVSNLKKWADEASAKEKAEMERKQKEEEKKRKEQEEWDKWWNSLSDEEKKRQKDEWQEQATYGYGTGRYNGD